jgi:hypothetical protein
MATGERAVIVGDLALLTPAPAERRPRAGTALRLVAVALVLLGLGGLTTWLIRLSPVGLERWRAIETSRPITFDEPGTYVIYEESPGASIRRGAPEVLVSVRSIAGRALPVRTGSDLPDGIERTYHVATYEGRAIAAVDVDRPGRYVIVSFPAAALGTPDRGRQNPPAVDLSSLPSLAVAPEGKPSRWGGYVGLVVLVGVPLAGAVLAAVIARRRYPAPLGPVVAGRSRPR